MLYSVTHLDWIPILSVRCFGVAPIADTKKTCVLEILD